MYNKKTKLVAGVGFNDADYETKNYKIYEVWSSMLLRCYGVSIKKSRPNRRNFYVCDGWLTFSNFKEWMKNKDWDSKEISVTIISTDNRCYSPSTCFFVTKMVSGFISRDFVVKAGGLLPGVSIEKNGTYKASIRNPFTKKREYLGLHGSEIVAHLTWKKRKNELACQLAELQTDQRVADALRLRYKPA